jgi:hypothetical protein
MSNNSTKEQLICTNIEFYLSVQVDTEENILFCNFKFINKYFKLIDVIIRSMLIL